MFVFEEVFYDKVYFLLKFDRYYICLLFCLKVRVYFF